MKLFDKDKITGEYQDFVYKENGKEGFKFFSHGLIFLSDKHNPDMGEMHFTPTEADSKEKVLIEMYLGLKDYLKLIEGNSKANINNVEIFYGPTNRTFALFLEKRFGARIINKSEAEMTFSSVSDDKKQLVNYKIEIDQKTFKEKAKEFILAYSELFEKILDNK